jgi:hypothetical protein
MLVTIGVLTASHLASIFGAWGERANAPQLGWLSEPWLADYRAIAPDVAAEVSVRQCSMAANHEERLSLCATCDNPVFVSG